MAIGVVWPRNRRESVAIDLESGVIPISLFYFINLLSEKNDVESG